MRFENILILNSLIFVIPLLVLLYFKIFKKHNSIINKIGQKELVLKLIKSISLKRKGLKIKLIFLAVILIFLALSRLQLGLKTIEARRKGVDVIIALDTSLSMFAEDVKPNRLEKAKKEIEKLINILKGDRVGLIGFSGTAFMLCPLTLDKNTAKLFLSILDNEIMPVQGTAIAKAINLAKKSFSEKERKYKVLILITDGEDHQGSVIKAAKEANKQGIQIFSIGIGNLKGEPIPIKDKAGRKIGYKKDSLGNVIVSKLGEDTLQKAAEVTGGQYYHVISGDWGLTKIYKRISSLEKKELKTKLITVYEEKYQFFLVFAIILLMLELLISERKKKNSANG